MSQLHLLDQRRRSFRRHFAVAIKTKQLVQMDVSSEKVHDGKRLKRLVNRAEESVRVRRVLGDGA